jgi:hypothetical protein
MTADDFQWLGDKIALYFLADARERGTDLLTEVQENPEELETDRQSLPQD